MAEKRRLSVAEVAAMTGAGAHLPPTVVAPEAPRNGPAPGGGRKPEPGYEVVAMNFKCTPDMARLLARLAEPAGGLRRFMARMLRDAGHEVPEHDLNPPTNRRWGGGGG